MAMVILAVGLSLIWAIPRPTEKGVFLFLGHLWDIRWEIQTPLTALAIVLVSSYVLIVQARGRRTSRT